MRTWRDLVGALVFPRVRLADSDGMTGAGDWPGQRAGVEPGTGPERQWDVALSFAGAQRDYVDQVANALRARGVRCFYDADEQIELWGKYLAEELPAIYGEQAAAVVVFVSAEYAAQDWPRLERRAALARAVRERQEYVLPARFDDTPLPGLLSDLVAVDLRGRTPEQCAAMIAAKLVSLAVTGGSDGPRVLAGPPPAGRPLAEMNDPFALEVHRPVQPEDLSPGGLPELPAYMPREHDQLLAQVVRATAGGSSGIAVLVGGSSTGKTRACWEALGLLRNQDPPWRLWHPIDPTRPDAALRELPNIGPRTVVWLNEAQFYLDVAEARLGERVAAGLRELMRDRARAPVLVLATLWPQYWEALTVRPPGGSSDPRAQARELLAGHDITVPTAFTSAQMGRLAESGDARLMLAARLAEEGEVIQFLAGAPELLARYRNADATAKALIQAAMDARRLGTGVGLPHAFLETAAPGYLTGGQWDALGEDWLEQALVYTAIPAKGTRGPLTHIRPRPAASRAARSGSRDSGEQSAGGPGGVPGGLLYRLADYLDQYGRQHRKGQIPPPEFWAAAAAHALPTDQAALGAAAHALGLFRDTAQLYKNAISHGDPYPATGLLNVFEDVHPADRHPANWVVTHVAVHDPTPVSSLFPQLRRVGTEEDVITLADRAAKHASLTDPEGVAKLLERLQEAGASEQVAKLLDRDPAAQVAIDDVYDVIDLLNVLIKAGSQQQAHRLVYRATIYRP